MTDAAFSPRTVGRRIKWEQRSFWRNPAAAAFTFAFPLLFLVIFIAINGNQRVDIDGTSIRFAQFYVPSIVAFGLISACYTNLAFTLSARRENGLLKRIRGTPLSPLNYFAGLSGSVVIVAMILTALVMALGVFVYDVTFPGRYLGLVVAVACAAFCFSSLGVLVATFVPNEDAAPAIINFVVFPLLFISGTFGQVEAGSLLDRIASVFPIKYLNDMLVQVFNPAIGGSGIELVNVAVMLGWGIVALAWGIRRFRWEPNR